jgi:hypothetical protein
MDLVDLGPIPWKIEGRSPTCPQDLGKSAWAIADAGEPGSAKLLLQAFHAVGASGGSVLTDDKVAADTAFIPDTTALPGTARNPTFPCYRFTAVLRKHHPYSELKARLDAAVSA